MDHNPSRFLSPGNPNPAKLLILNSPITPVDGFARLWANTSYHLCADGGANRLYDIFSSASPSLPGGRDEYLPDMIHGDLDSLLPKVRRYYSSHSVPVTLDEDQYSTDFGKAMGLLNKQLSPGTEKKQEVMDVLILGSLGGRVDQGLGLLHELYREQLKRPSTRLWLFSESSVSFLLKAGKHTIHTGVQERYFTTNVGLLPIFGPAVITTEGLEWDVKEWKTKMGEQVSTSNHVVNEMVVVETDEVILFTIERGGLPS